jgi:O-antigen ligase
MEYLLQSEKNQKYLFLTGVVTAVFLVLLFVWFYAEPLIFAGVVGILISFLLTPLLYKKHQFFLILWLLIVPFFDNFTPLLIKNTSIITYIATFLSIPSAFVLFHNKFGEIKKNLPFIKYIALFFLLVFLNFFRPDTPSNAINEVVRNIVIIFLIFTVYFYSKSFNFSDLAMKKMFNWINIFCVSNSLFAIFQRITGIGMKIIEGIPRSQGFLGHPNVTGFVVNIFFPVSVYMFLNAKSKREKIQWGVSILVNLLALLLTFTKICYLSLFMTLAVLFLYLSPKIKWRIFFSLTVISGLLLLVNWLVGLNMLESVIERINNTSSYSWRLKIWNYLSSEINISNILQGHGINSVVTFLVQLDRAPHAHNMYLQLMYEYGMTGIIFILAFISPALAFFKKLKTEEMTKPLVIFPLIIIAIVFINMYSDNSVMLRTPMFYFWTIITLFYCKVFLNSKTESV